MLDPNEVIVALVIATRVVAYATTGAGAVVIVARSRVIVGNTRARYIEAVFDVADPAAGSSRDTARRAPHAAQVKPTGRRVVEEIIGEPYGGAVFEGNQVRSYGIAHRFLAPDAENRQRR